MLWILAAYVRLGPITSAGPLGGLMLNHSAVYGPRQEWLDREACSRGLDREAFELIWADLDSYFIDRAQAEMKKDA